MQMPKDYPEWNKKKYEPSTRSWAASQDRYAQYLESDEWRQMKLRRLEIDNYTCQICGSKGSNMNPLNVHHLSYHNIYHENIDKDLVTLCRSCHMGVHNMMNRITNSETGQRGWKDTLSVSMISYNRFREELMRQGGIG